MTHRTTILPTSNGKYVAICSCPYTGPDRKDRLEAVRDAGDHLVAERRHDPLKVK